MSHSDTAVGWFGGQGEWYVAKGSCSMSRTPEERVRLDCTGES